MASLSYRCRICGADLREESAADSHLMMYPTHLIEEVLYDPSTYADLESAPSTTKLIDDELYTYDTTRSRWLSVNRVTAYFCTTSSTRNVWLKVFGGLQTSSQYTGFHLPNSRALVLTKAVTERSSSSNIGTFRVSLDYSSTGIAQVVQNNGNFELSDLTLNILLTAGTDITVYYSCSSNSYSQIWLDLAWDGGA